jgi:putative phosphoribosyl transferase
VVDDGLATGSTLKAAVQAIRIQTPKEIIVGVPIGAPDTCADFKAHAERVICVKKPEPFYSVGLWYQTFLQTTDEEVQEILRQAHEKYC